MSNCHYEGVCTRVSLNIRTGGFSKIDGSFIATILETAAVAVLYFAWRSITEGAHSASHSLHLSPARALPTPRAVDASANMSLRLRRVVGGGYLLPSVTRRPVTPGHPGPRTGPFGACSRSLHAPAAPRPHLRCDAASRWSLTISALLSFCLDTRFPLCFPIRILWTVAPARCRRSQSIDPPHEPAHSLLVYFVVSMLCVAHISRFPL